MIGIDDIEAARERIAPHVRRTPVHARSTSAKDRRSRRGARDAEARMPAGDRLVQGARRHEPPARRRRAEELADGIVTASGGNHGLAVARTAYRGRTCRRPIFLPSNVSPAKVAKMKALGRDGRDRRRRLGRRPTQPRSTYADDAPARSISIPSPTRSSSRARARSASKSSTTCPISTPILVAIGGGGLISGLATAIQARRPEHPHHRRRADRLADAEGEPRRRPRGHAARGHDRGADHVLPARPTSASSRLVRNDGRRDRARQRRGDGGRRALALVRDRRRRRSLRRGLDRRAAAEARPLWQVQPAICALVCGAGPDGMGSVA